MATPGDLDARSASLARALVTPVAVDPVTDPAIARLVDALGPGLEEAVTSDTEGIRGVLRVRAFRRLWIALAGSSLGDWLGLLAQISLAKELGARSGGLSGGAFAIGAVMLLRLVPALVIGPFAGAIADRFDRRRLMVAADLGRALLFISIPLVRELWWLTTATFLVEVLALFWIPAKEASVPNLLRRSQLEAANTLSLITTYGMAPVAAGVFALLASLSRGLGSFESFFTANPVDLALYVDSASFAFSALTVLGLREISGRRSTPREQQGRRVLRLLLRDMADGWRFVGGEPLVRGLTLGIVGAFGSVGTIVACGPLFVEALGGGEAAFGLFFGAAFLGLAAGMLGGRVVLGDFPRRRLFGLAISLAGSSLAVVAILPNLVVALMGVLVVGTWAGIAWVTGYSLLGGEVADEIRARTFSIVQTLVQVTLFAVLAAAPFLIGAIGFHAVHLGNGATVRADGATIVLFAGGVVGLAAGVVALRQMDDRRGISITSDLVSALRPHTVRVDHPGLFIAVEGGEGAGKSTQLALLAEWLRGAGHEVVLTREPGATPVGARVRSLLLDPAVSVAPRAELLLYAADRAQHVAEVVLPALQRGAVVLTDRFADSTRAYQGGGRRLAESQLEELIATATGGLEPDLVVLLDLPPAVGLARAASRGAGVDRIEGEALDFHQRVRHRFLELARAKPRRWVVVDAGQPTERVSVAVRAELLRRLGPDRLTAGVT